MGEPFWSCDATLAKIVDRFREMHRTSGDVGSAEAKMVLTEKDVAASSSGSGAKDRGEGGDGGGRPSPGDEKKKKRNETRPVAFLLDDGAQHVRLRRDLEVVMVHALNGWGNGRIVPRG